MNGNICECCGLLVFMLIKTRVGRASREEQWRCWPCVERAWKEASGVSPVEARCAHGSSSSPASLTGVVGGVVDGGTVDSAPPPEPPPSPGRWGAKGYYWAKPEHGPFEIVKYDGRGGVERMGRDGLYRLPVFDWTPLAFIPEWTEAPQ